MESKNSQDRINTTLTNTVEKRIDDWKDNTEEFIQIAEWRDKEKNMKENLGITDNRIRSCNIYQKFKKQRTELQKAVLKRCQLKFCRIKQRSQLSDRQKEH